VKSFKVNNWKNLTGILKACPSAQVQSLTLEPSQDVWLVNIPEESDVRGPMRVVVQVEDGTVAYAVSPGQAVEEFNIIPDVVLVRKDGWTLGARIKDRDAAVALWEGDWVAEFNLSSGFVTIHTDQVQTDHLPPEADKPRRGPKPIRKN